MQWKGTEEMEGKVTLKGRGEKKAAEGERGEESGLYVEQRNWRSR